MNTIIKSMLTIAAVFTVASVSAQPQREERQTPENRAKHMSERMAEKLDLTDAQKQQIYDLHIELAKEAEATRPERGQRGERGERPTEEQAAKIKEARQAMMEKHKARMDEVDAKVKEILTPDQYEKWESEKGKGQRMQERGSRGPRNGEAAEHGPRKPRHNYKTGKGKKAECNCKSEIKE